jgi:hypothetical protein
MEIRSARGGGGRKLTALSFVLFFYCFNFLMERRREELFILQERERLGERKGPKLNRTERK